MRIELTELKQKSETDKAIVALVRHNHWFIFSLETHSRYFGYWVNLNGTIYRLIDSIDLQETIEQISVTGPASVRLIFRNGQIEFSLDDQGLKLKASRPIDLSIVFDVRLLKSKTDWGNSYTFLPAESIYTLHFRQEQENWSLETQINYQGELKLVDQWLERDYPFDLQRQSPPFKRFVFAGLRGRVLSLKIFCPDKSVITPISLTLTDSLSNFLLQRCLNLFNGQHFMAGLPWFPQRWFRDELISLWNFENIIKTDILLEDYYNNLSIWWSKNQPAGTTAVDTLLWLLFISPLSLIEQHFDQIEPVFRNWLDTYLKTELKLGSQQTWMDTISRERAIEIDCLFLATLRKLKQVSSNLKLTDLADYFQRKIKTEIISGTYPIDELNRPNVFLAYLIYPSLVSTKIWRQLFDQVIQKNFTSWGGFSSLNQDAPNYQAVHTGEDSKSYHQGDSWFWLNNIAALALHQFDYQTYDEIIRKIIQASIKDLFTYGLGWSSELSSSSNFQPAGSPIQLWSIATLLRLLHQVKPH
jgi:hypothetical protein